MRSDLDGIKWLSVYCTRLFHLHLEEHVVFSHVQRENDHAPSPSFFVLFPAFLIQGPKRFL